MDAKQRDDGLEHIKDEERVALAEEELAETKKKLIELKQEQSNPVTKNISGKY